MADGNWWESSPLVDGQKSEDENWWESSPLVEPPEAVAVAKRRTVPGATVGSVARDIAAGVLQIGPTAVKGVADIARLATGDAVGRDTSDALERGMASIRDTVGSERAAAQRENFQRDMADDDVGIGEALLRNKGALADQILPTIGSMFLPVGLAGAAGKAATAGRAAQALDVAALAGRVASAQKVAGVGATVAQNAASTFAELVDKGASMQDAYIGAGITVPFSVVAGALTGGGAEVAAARALTGSGAAKMGVKQLGKATGKEGAQEMGEELGQITGEGVATGQAPSATSAGKQLAVAGTLGAVMGGGVDVATQVGQRGQPAALEQPGTAPGQVPAPVEQQTEQQRAKQPDGVPDSMEDAKASMRLAELEVIDGSVGLNPAQQQERAALVQRVNAQAARELEQETIGESADAAADLDEAAAPQSAGAGQIEEAPAFDPAAAQSTSWREFVAERGQKLSTLRKGMPEWDQLQGEWAAVQASRAGDQGARPQLLQDLEAVVQRATGDTRKNAVELLARLEQGGLPAHVQKFLEREASELVAAAPASPAPAPAAEVARPAASVEPERLTPQERQEYERAYRRPVEDPLGELQGRVRAESTYTGSSEVQQLREQLEDAWLELNVATETPSANAAGPAPAPIDGEAIQQVDAKVRSRRIRDALQNLMDGEVSNTLQVVASLDGALERIGDTALNASERQAVLRVADAYFGFRGAGERAPLPSPTAALEDVGADNASMEALIQERGAPRRRNQAQTEESQEQGMQAPAASDTAGPAAFDPAGAQARTWPQFVAERGYKLPTLSKGTPVWNALRNEWDAVQTLRAGTNPEGTGSVGAPTPEIQNRDRARPASVVQMQAMAQNPDYMRLGLSRSPESGAPMVFAVGDRVQAAHMLGSADVAVMSDGQRVPFQYAVMEAADVQPSNFADGNANPMFESAHPGVVKALNNGRTAGLRAAYERGTADTYKRELIGDSAMHGIDARVIEGMKAPVLVRLYSEKNNQANMGAKSQSQALGLSAAEQAATDATLIDAATLEAFGAGEMDGAGNRDFARAFIGKLQAEGQDVAGMMDASGALSPAGVTRLQAALVHKAYGDGDLVESMFGSTDNDIRAIGESLKAVAGEWANMRHAAEVGAINPEVDVTGSLLQAIRLVQKARRERASLYDAINQVDMETGDVVDPLTVGLLRMLYSGHYLTRALGRDRVVDSLRQYLAASLATRSAGDMFGEQVGPADILTALNGQPTQQNNDARTQNPSQPAPDATQGERGSPGGVPPGRRSAEPGSEARGPRPDRAGQEAADAGGRSEGQDAQDPGRQQDGQSDQGPGQDSSGAVAPELALASYTPEEVAARQDAQAEADRQRAKDEAKADADAKAKRERKEVAARMDASAENFQLGQDAQDAISGQAGLIDFDDVPFRRGDQDSTADAAASSGMTPEQAEQLLRIMGQAPQPSRAAKAEAVNKVRATVDAIRAAWANGPEVIVVHDMSDAAIPRAARLADDAQRSGGAVGNPEGFYYGGKVYLLASQLPTPQDAARVLMHEALGHHGLRGVFGKDLDGVLEQIAAVRRDDVRRKAAEYGLDFESRAQRLQAAEEVLAEWAQSRPEMGYVRRAVAAIRTWVRRHVPGMKGRTVTDDEIIRSYILPARGWVERGAGAGQQSKTSFSRAGAQASSPLDTFPAEFMSELAAVDELFANPLVHAGSAEAALRQIDPSVKFVGDVTAQDERQESGADTKLLFRTSKGRDFFVFERGDNVWLDVSRLDEGDGGNAIYAALMDYAASEEKVFIGDPAGLSDVAMRRRLEAMISSAIKHGSTDHMQPHERQEKGDEGLGIPALKWRDGDTIGNIQRMIDASLASIASHVPEFHRARYDFATGTFRTGEGKPLPDGVLRRWTEHPRMRAAGLGRNSIKRGILLNTLAHAESGQQSGLLEQALRQPRQLVGGQAEGIFYSRTSAGSGDPSAPGAHAPQTKLAQLQAKVKDLTSRKSVDTWLYDWQDRFVDLKRIQENIKALNGTVSETSDAYRGEELYHKRVAKRTSNFLRDEVRPLLKALNESKVNIQDFERFLHARHAPEANRVMAERNPNQRQLDAKRAAAENDVKKIRLQLRLQSANPGGKPTVDLQKALGRALMEKDRWSGVEAFDGTEEQRLSLSGMSDQEANAIMISYAPAKRQAMEDLAARVDKINASTLQTLENYGLMNAETLDAWRKTYQHYVPLHRDEAHADSKAHPIGQGFSTKGDASKQRTGSNEKVTNILGHIVMQREAALTRGEKNNVVKRLYVLAGQNPDHNVWSLDLPKKKVVDPDTGLVKTVVDQGAKDKNHVVTLRIGGKDQYIVFNPRNERAVRLALAIKNMDTNELDWLSRTMGHITRWFAAVNTQYNPVFGVMNFARDVQGSMLQLSTTPLAGKQAEVFRNIRKNSLAIWSDLRRERKEAGAGKGQWAQLWEQMQLDGGTTGYRDLYADPKDRAKALQKALDQQGQGKTAAAGRALMEVLSDFNETLEATTRLAVYKAALDHGQSRDSAASIAKNITVNFNRRGKRVAVLGHHYAFMNAAIQGNKRLLETLAGPTGRKVMIGGVLLGMMSGMAGTLMMGGGGADDEWKKIPEFTKERSLIIPWPWSREDYVAIPLPLGFHVFPNIGRKMVEFAMHDDPTKNRGSHLVDLALIALNAYNPLGGSENISQMLTPTWLDPVVALWTNTDWTGKSIYREDRSQQDPKPGFTRAKDSTAAPYRWLAELANSATGGNEWRPGAFSPTPEAIEYLVEQFTGGVGRELNKVGAMSTAAVTGEELAPHQLVLVGRIYGNTRGANGESTTYYENIRRINTSSSEAKGRSERGEDVGVILEDVPLAKLDGAAGVFDKRVSDLVKARRRIQASDNPNKRELVKEINQEIEASMYQLNKAVEETLTLGR